jgi:hypothetical protein
VADRRRTALLAAALVAAAGVGIWTASRASRTAPPPIGAAPPAAAPTPAPLAPDAGAPPPAAPPELAADAPAFDPRTWDAVDLDDVRAALPRNLYWDLGFPTEDLRVQRDREESAAHWNGEYGKVLSGTGTDDEIRAYYAHRQQVSADYAEFATYVLDRFEKSLPERDVALLELARKLHLARLEEIPRRLEEGFARKRAQDAAREAWLADEAAFQNDVPNEGGGADN